MCSVQTQLTDRETIRRLVWLFVWFTLVALVAGASRMWWRGWQMHTFGDIIRWREALSMFVFAPAISVLFWLIVRCVGHGRMHPVVQVLCLLSIYLVACGMGMHDPTNRMTSAYRASQMQPAVWQTIGYLDDGLSHWVFFGGFILGTWALGVQQALVPFQEKPRRLFVAALLVMSLFLIFVIYTNLVTEYPKTKLDCRIILTAVMVPTLVALARLRTVGILRMPVFLIILPSYWGGILLTNLTWFFQGKCIW